MLGGRANLLHRTASAALSANVLRTTFLAGVSSAHLERSLQNAPLKTHERHDVRLAKFMAEMTTTRGEA